MVGPTGSAGALPFFLPSSLFRLGWGSGWQRLLRSFEPGMINHPPTPDFLFKDH